MGIKDLIKMNDEQPTPITDAATHSDWCGALAVEVETSQMLERDLYKAREQISVMRKAIREAYEALAGCTEDSGELLAERDWWKDEPRCDYQVRHDEHKQRIEDANAALTKLQPFLP